MKLFQTIAYSGTIWLVACLVNGIASGIYVMNFENDFKDASTIVLSVIFSMAFSMPGIILFWLVFFVGVMQERKGQSLFRYTLTTALGCSVLSGVIFCPIMYHAFKSHVFVLGGIAVLAALISLFIHRRLIIELYD